MAIKERIKEYLAFRGISPTAAERKLGWGVGAFTKAKSITSDRAAEFLIEYGDLSAEWLMRGDGEMIKKPAVTDVQRITTLVDALTALTQAVNDKDETIAALREEIVKLKSITQ